MECIKCKAHLPPDAVFCCQCGKKQITMSKKRHAKRCHGQGSITKLSGNRAAPYLARLPATYGNKQVGRRSLGYYPTYLAADAALQKAKALLSRTGSNITLEDTYDVFLSSNYYKSLASTSQSAHRNAWSYLKIHASVQISTLTKAEFQAVADHMAQKGLKRETIAKMRNLASLLCKEAMGLGLLSVNYGQLVQLPREDKTDKPPFTSDQLKRLWQSADGGNNDALAVLIMCYIGMRPGELLGVDISTHLHTTDTFTYFCTGSKTEAGRDRIIPIPASILPFVQALCGDRTLGPLIAAQGGKCFRLDTWRNRRFNPLMDCLGIQGCTPYTGRHTYANLQKRRQVDAELMMEIMGHESYSTTVEHYHTTTEEDISRICSAADGLSRPA